MIPLRASGREPQRPLRLESPRQERREQLIEQIRLVHEQSRETYGSPRVHAQLVEQEVKVCLNTIAELMREESLSVEKKPKFEAQSN